MFAARAMKRLISAPLRAVAPEGSERRVRLLIAARHAGLKFDTATLVRDLELLRRTSKHPAAMKALSAVTADEIMTALGERAGIHLLATRHAMGYGPSDDVPVALRHSRELVEAAGKRWELTREVPPWLEADRPTEVYKKIAIRVERPGLVDAASRLTVIPPHVAHADVSRSRRGRGAYEVPRLDGGWVQLQDVIAAAESNAFIGHAQLFVDEYRNEYSQVADPRSDPLVLGVSRDEVLAPARAHQALAPSDRGLRGFWLAGRFSAEWGHFVNSHLTHIQYFREHPRWGMDPVYIRSGLSSQSMELLAALMPGVRLIPLEPGHKVHFESVVTVPSRVFSPANVREVTGRPQANVFVEPEQFSRLYEDLRVIGKNAPKPAVGTRLLVSRGAHGRRALSNREELNALAHARGLEVVDPTALSAAEQLALWQRATLIVGELASWVFLGGMSSASRIIALNSDWDQQWWAELSGIDATRERTMSLVLGQRLDPQRSRSENAPHAAWSLTRGAFDALDGLVLNAR